MNERCATRIELMSGINIEACNAAERDGPSLPLVPFFYPCPPLSLSLLSVCPVRRSLSLVALGRTLAEERLGVESTRRPGPPLVIEHLGEESRGRWADSWWVGRHIGSWVGK